MHQNAALCDNGLIHNRMTLAYYDSEEESSLYMVGNVFCMIKDDYLQNDRIETSSL